MLIFLLICNLFFVYGVFIGNSGGNFPIVQNKKSDHQILRIEELEKNETDIIRVQEKNIQFSPNTTEIKFGVDENGKFKPLSSSIKGIKVVEKENCGKEFFPHRFFIDWISGIPKMLCEAHHCLNPAKIECRSNVEMAACKGSDEWVAGFIGKNNGTHDLMEVECCKYSETLFTAFVKKINVTLNEGYDHELGVENEKLISVDFINNVKKMASGSNEPKYLASVYRMKCPSSSTNVYSDQIRNFANTKINSPEKAKLFSTTLKQLITELDRRSQINTTALNFPVSGNATIRDHPMLQNISTVEEAEFQASAMKFIASEMTKGPFGSAFNDISLPSEVARDSSSVGSNQQLTSFPRQSGNHNYPTHRSPSSYFHGPNYPVSH